MLGYFMKDACKEHFETVDHNITAEDLNIGMEQYALYGREDNKNCIVLTMRNLADRVLHWRRFHCTHPLVVDFERDLYEMLKYGKYYLATNWVVGGASRGYINYIVLSAITMEKQNWAERTI